MQLLGKSPVGQKNVLYNAVQSDCVVYPVCKEVISKKTVLQS